MQKKGGAAILRGVQKIKKKKDRGRAWACGLWVGPVQPMNLGSVRERYLRVVRPFFPHFSLFFLSLLSFESKRSLLSPKAAPTRRLAIVDGAAAALDVFFLFFFLFLCILSF